MYWEDLGTDTEFPVLNCAQSGNPCRLFRVQIAYAELSRDDLRDHRSHSRDFVLNGCHIP